MFTWFGRWYRARQRRIDVKILWPVIKKQVGIAKAREVFYVHCACDDAWTREYKHADLVSFIAELD
jgi:hypothetical protein